MSLKELDEKIQLMKKTVEELQSKSGHFPALRRNTARIQASLKMLELNISDIAQLEE